MIFWERWRIPILLAPTLSVIGVLFLGALGFGFVRSLGYNPRIGETTLSLDAYHAILFGEQYANAFWHGLGLSLWVSFATTGLSAVIAVVLALVLRETFPGKRLSVFLFQFNLPIPHIVAAIGMLFLLSQSGLLSRLLATMGLVNTPSDFPVLVRDRAGLGIIIAYTWKEVPFVGVIVLAVLQSLGAEYENVARNLGAGPWQCFRTVTLPLITPALLSASMIVFAFSFGAYEIPAILGVRFPRMLPVMALDFFRNADLNARAEAMALSVLIALIVMVIVAAYMVVSGRRRT
jgi:putative spermidine/putrescine transport system permease protein